MRLESQWLLSAHIWFSLSLFVFVAFRFARLRGGRGFRRKSHER